jgi:hypothetical protein
MSTYLEKQSLAMEPDFLKRVTHAVARFAFDIMNEATSVPNHNARYKWASVVIMNPTPMANSISPTVVIDPQVDANLGAVTDADLQVAVTNACSLLAW